MRRLLAATGLALLAGCANQAAYGRTENVQNAWPSFSGYTKAHLAVAVLDHRSYVLSGGKPANFAGLQRGGFGNPFDVVTTSGRPLADDVGSAIVQGLSNAGMNAQAVAAPAAEPRAAAGSKLLLLTVKEWKSDSYTSTSFDYDLDAAVYDAQGRVAGKHSAVGHENASSGVDGGRKALTDLLGDKSVSGALFDPVH